MSKSNIGWTDETWNCVTGCTRASRGCDSCYAFKMTKRLESMGQKKYSGLAGKKHFNGMVRCHDDELIKPFSWKKPRMVFVNSMSDTFHKDVPFEFIDKMIAVMALTPWNTYQLLTKRADRMEEYFNDHNCDWDALKYAEEFVSEMRGDLPAEWMWDTYRDDEGGKDCELEYHGDLPLPNVWIGVSCEDQEHLDKRLPHLLNVPSSVRFISIEPMLEHVDLAQYTHRLSQSPSWVICGGESTQQFSARPFPVDAAKSLIEQCRDADIPTFFKQFGSNPQIPYYCDDDGLREWVLNRSNHKIWQSPGVEWDHQSFGQPAPNATISFQLGRKGEDPEMWPEWARVQQFPGAS